MQFILDISTVVYNFYNHLNSVRSKHVTIFFNKFNVFLNLRLADILFSSYL